MTTDSSARAKDIVSMEEATSTDVAEDMADDVEAAQLEVNVRHTEVGATATPTEIAHTREETARYAQKATRKRLLSSKCWEDHPHNYN